MNKNGHRKLYFLTYKSMVEAASFILAAQGFAQRADQYRAIKSKSVGGSGESNGVEIRSVIHRITREKYILKKVSKEAP